MEVYEILLLVLWVSFIVGFVWYLYQYQYGSVMYDDLCTPGNPFHICDKCREGKKKEKN